MKLSNVQHQIDGTSAYIMVDDLNHLVKGGQMGLPFWEPLEHCLFILMMKVIEVLEESPTEKKGETLGVDLLYQISQMVITKSLSSMPMSPKARHFANCSSKKEKETFLFTLWRG